MDRLGDQVRTRNKMNTFFANPTSETRKRSIATGAVGKVVSMDRFRSGKSLSPIRQAEAYWSALRDGTAVPRRSQIDPRGLENILEYAFIIERIAPGVARFRLAGHHLNDLTGMELRGMPLTALFTPAARSQTSVVLEHMFDAPCMVEMNLREETKRGNAPTEARMLLLPLENDVGEVTRALGVLVAETGAGYTPKRFDVMDTALRPVTGPVIPQPHPDMADGPAKSAQNPDIPGFAETQEPVAGARTHLRLVK